MHIIPSEGVCTWIYMIFLNELLIITNNLEVEHSKGAVPSRCLTF